MIIIKEIRISGEELAKLKPGDAIDLGMIPTRSVIHNAGPDGDGGILISFSYEEGPTTVRLSVSPTPPVDPR